MKAVISNRIYLQVTDEYKDFLSKELTYTIPSYNPTDPPLVIKNMARIKTGLVSIPVGRTDLIPQDYEVVDKREVIKADFPKFKFDLRESQKAVYDELNDNAIINAWVSWGKTFTALAIAGKLGQKTLVVTHTVPLRKQWENEVKKVFGFQPGIVGSGKFRAQSYPGDIDLMEKIEMCCSKRDIARFVTERLQRIARDIKESEHVYLGDFKAGLDNDSKKFNLVNKK